MKRKSSISSQKTSKKQKSGKITKIAQNKRKRSNSIDTTVSSSSLSTVSSISSRRSLRIATKRAKENGYDLEINTDKVSKRGSIILEDHLFESEFGICLTPTKQTKKRKPTPHPRKIVKKSELVRKIAFDHSGSLSETSSLEKTSIEEESATLETDCQEIPLPVEPCMQKTSIAKSNTNVQAIFWFLPMILAVFVALGAYFMPLMKTDVESQVTLVENSSKDDKQALMREIQTVLLSQSQQIMLLKNRLQGLKADFEQL